MSQMTPQTFPLYTTRNGRPFLVVGWTGFTSNGQTYPVLAPLDRPGSAVQCQDPELIYSLTPPARVPEPGEAVTEIIPHYWPSGRVRPL